jgi:ATP-dependent protease ClpP protease subunit
MSKDALKPDSVWETVLPIVKTGTTTEAYLSDGIGEPGYYNELCHILRKAESHETVVIYLNSPGGIIDAAFMIIDAITCSKAHVVAHLTGMVASAATMIALTCDEIIVSKHLSFMIHNYSGGMQGKGHEMKARQEFADKSLEKAFTSFYGGFLTKDEIKEVIDGKDLWMDEDEVLERWGNMKQEPVSSDSTEEHD